MLTKNHFGMLGGIYVHGSASNLQLQLNCLVDSSSLGEPLS